jgi:ferredoxin-NADP reductase
LAGDFTLPKDQSEKLVFIAGGIGITPFRSMAQYLMDTKQKRDIVMLYSNKTIPEIAYRDVFDRAQEIGLKTVYTVTNENPIPQDWTGKTGFINEAMLREEVPDFKTRMFYISGPRSMVVLFDDLLKKMGVPESNIKKDFFPGFV